MKSVANIRALKSEDSYYKNILIGEYEEAVSMADSILQKLGGG
jgi:hypothetical protein